MRFFNVFERLHAYVAIKAKETIKDRYVEKGKAAVNK